MRKAHVVVGLAVLALLAVGAAAPPPKPATGTDETALAALNRHSRAIYRDSRARILKDTGPVIVVVGGTLILHHHGRRTERDAIPPIYHSLKTIAHIPLAVHALLSQHVDGPLSEAVRQSLVRYRKALAPFADRLDETVFPTAAVRDRQSAIVKRSLAFIDAVLRAGKCDRRTLQAYCRSLRPALDANVSEAARAQIDGFHKQVSAWRRTIPAADWARLRVLVLGQQLPRKDNLAVQYFARVLGVEGESDRLIYAEGLDEVAALNLLGTRLLDARIGEDFFGDAQRMYRDLLGDAAKVYLKKVPGP